MRTPIFLALAICSAAAAAAPPQRVELVYAVSMGNLKIGEGREKLEQDGERYTIVSESKPLGIAALFVKEIRRESRGTVGPAGLRPQHYEENRGKDGARSAEFDWSAGKVVINNNGEVKTEALPEGALDMASLPFSFAFVPPAGDSFRTNVTDGRRLTDYQLRVLGRETLKTTIGDLETLHVQKVRVGDDKRGLDFWLAVDRQYLPVRIRFTEKDGTAFDSIVTAINLR